MQTQRYFSQRDSLRHYSIFVLIGICLVALSLPRFGFLWHTHTGGEATHTHDIYTLAHQPHTPHTPPSASHGHVHSHTHDHSSDHAHSQRVYDHDQHAHDPAPPHEPAADVSVRFVDATSSGLHAHYFDDSLSVGNYLLPLPTLVVLTAVLYACHRESLPARHLMPPTARDPPA